MMIFPNTFIFATQKLLKMPKIYMFFGPGLYLDLNLTPPQINKKSVFDTITFTFFVLLPMTMSFFGNWKLEIGGEFIVRFFKPKKNYMRLYCPSFYRLLT